MLNFRCTKSGVITLLSPDPSHPKADSQAKALEAKGFVRAGLSAFQLFGKEKFNRILIYQKKVEQGQEYQFGKWSVLVGPKVVTRWQPSQQPMSSIDNDGELRVEVPDESGKIIAPFFAENCEPVSADKTRQTIRWQGANGLSAIHDQAVKFRFHLTTGKLYAFWVSPDESGASNGYVAAGGPEYTGYKDSVDASKNAQP